MSAPRAAALLVITGISCANLPDIQPGTCGNGVVEPPEDCDTFAPTPSSVCLPRGAPGECHLDCHRQADGSRPTCPAGWGCDRQSICRPPTGDFDLSAPFSVGGAWSLLAGDFDGDGRQDVVSLEERDLRGATKLDFHYFDEDGLLRETQAFPKMLASPVIADLAQQDGRGDLVFSDQGFGIGVLQGQSDRTWIPETAGSYRFPGTVVRLVSVSDETVERSNSVMGLATIEGKPGLYGPNQGGALVQRGALPGPIEALVGDPVTGDIIEDPRLSPCREVVTGFRDAVSFLIMDTCTRVPATDAIVWRDMATAATVWLDPPAPIDVAPQLTDLNGDGHLDVLLGAGGSAYVAYGDGRGLQTAVPYRRPGADPLLGAPEGAMPLAVGDFTGDGVVDFVFGDHLLISVRAPDGSLGYLPDHLNQAAPWTIARIADLNGNGKADVVAASSERVGIDFFNGTGTTHLLAFSVRTNAPVRSLVVADVDGDLINDLAFIESAAAGSGSADRDSLMIAFGGPAGPPTAPRLVARIAHIDQLAADRELGIGNLVVSYTEEVNGAKNGVLAFLAGSGDRLPFAPYDLVDVPRGSVFQSAALGLTVGRFGGGGPGDVLALGSSSGPQARVYEFWLLRALGAPGSGPVRLGGQLDPRLRALRLDAFHIGVNVTAMAADLDGDGRDEAVWAIPADDDAHCGLVFVGVTGGDGGVPGVLDRGTIVLDPPCRGAQLVPVDADGDGAMDIALLTGSPGGPERRLLVLWNDGVGGFTNTAVTTVNAAGDSPEQFTVLPATPGHPLALAYVTDRSAVLVAGPTTDRHFALPRTLVELPQASGIVAADVNGDGVVDLAIAAAGNLRVLKARLLTP